MRSLAAALLLAGCVTANAPPDHIEGCWIERTARGGAATMRWFPDNERPEVIVGHYLSYPGSDTRRTYTLAPIGDGNWNFCFVQSSGEQRCWAVARGQGGSLQGGRAFIDIHGERIRIAIIDGSVERVVFQGVRDGCD
jgi:hypothetical protein